MFNVKIIVDTNCSLTILCIVQIKQIDLLVTKEQAHLILVLVTVLSNEGSGEPVHMYR